MEQQIVEQVNQSYGRCLLKGKFLDDFYDNFLKSSDKIAPMFANTDFAKQKQLLKSTITFVIMHAKDENAAFAKNKLESVGKIHSRDNINVNPNLYPFWVDSLIKTIQIHDENFSPELEKTWKQVVAPALALLTSKY